LYSPHLKVKIRLFGKGEGSRIGALPEHEWKTIVRCKDENWSALLKYEGSPAPGDTFVASVTLLSPKLALSAFSVGASFSVLEIVSKGEGVVLSLIE
jgi:hypothetical protein